MSDREAPYRVLARKYRPASFAGLIGQEAMVKTLQNAISSGRVAHAFIFTGVRGVGKTTTARILARALNCVGADGKGGPTPEPCGICPQCRAIGEDRHIDVIEMDAASRTGVEDIRELTEGVRYRPVSGRCKITIIDEVHMLSKNAFNALLKTLEEPPPDVKFVFATTEVQKVPLTVLSRCQSFALRRVPAELLLRHYAEIAAAEGIEAEPAALALIARAADGSVRDGLSLLDQAIALGGARVSEKAVRAMLGAVDPGFVFDLFESVLKGDAASALGLLRRLYEGGADPLTVLQELLRLTHLVTALKLVPEAGDGESEEERRRARPLAEKLEIPVLARAWQMLLKGVAEVEAAPAPLRAAEMVLVRLAYVADLPSPAELVAAIAQSPPPREGRASGSSPPSLDASSAALENTPPTMQPPQFQSAGWSRSARSAASPMGAPAGAAEPVFAEEAAAPAFEAMPQGFADLLALCDKRREPVMRSHLARHLHLVHFEPGRIEFRPAPGAPHNLANRLGELLREWTGRRWVVAVSAAEGAPTLKEEEERQNREERALVAAHPLVRAVLETFPGATLMAIRERFREAEAESEAPLAEGETGEEANAEREGS
jgi:DNA polymerase III subunit gamma/tau